MASPKLVICIPTEAAKAAAAGGSYQDHINISLMTYVEQIDEEGNQRKVHETYIHFASTNVTKRRIVNAETGEVIDGCTEDGEVSWAKVSASRGTLMDGRRSNRVLRRNRP